MAPRLTARIDQRTRALSHTARTWGSTADERELAFACEKHLACHDIAVHRAIEVAAPAATVFRWLCQLRVAPYSYDWIDNLGRRSPRRLTPGLDELAVGQTLMGIFELVEFAPDQHLTLVLRRPRRASGEVAVTYMVVPTGDESCR